MSQKHIILGVHITDRVTHASQVQQTLTQYGANVKTRLGLHEIAGNQASPNGLILLEMAGDEARCLEVAARLGAIKGVEVQKMVFDHP